MINCPDMGDLRASIDDADSAPTRTTLKHVETCSRCKSELAELRANAMLASGAFALLEQSGETHDSVVIGGRTTVSSYRRGQDNRRLITSGHRGIRWRLAMGTVAAAILVTIALVTPQGQTVAAEFLAQFRGQRLAVVSIDPTQASLQLPELGSLGIMKGETRRRPEPVASLAEASQATGFQVRAPAANALPATVQAEPHFSVLRANEIRITFDAARAAEYFKSVNHAELGLPNRINGTTMVVSVPAVALLEYSATAPNDLGVMVAQAGELHAGTEGGASLDEIREYLLTLPTLTESTRRQLSAMGDWRSTLPIPVPVEQVQWTQTTVGDSPAYVFANKNGLGGALLWTSTGRIYGVGGLASETDLQRVANSLR
ncbi:MAG TPA: hypothetical protein VHX16_12615 [Chloroflexota bacterium]|jgi:hypothetical protein|nr:hypothetical protein [Chloroflexota bacterium]